MSTVEQQAALVRAETSCAMGELRRNLVGTSEAIESLGASQEATVDANFGGAAAELAEVERARIGVEWAATTQRLLARL